MKAMSQITLALHGYCGFLLALKEVVALSDGDDTDIAFAIFALNVRV